MTEDDGTRDGPSMNIVLADDNDDHALLIQMALENAAPGPLTIRRAHDGDEAIELVEQEPPDLLLLDLNMPGRHGHEVLERLKGDDRLRRVPVAVLTSSDRDEDMAQSYGLGGNHFITKPADPAELEARLESLLNNLRDLQVVTRGKGSMRAGGLSAVDPDSVAIRRNLPWFAFGMAVVIIVVFGRCAGVL
jgi:CheY-like chemotaxis protein